MLGQETYYSPALHEGSMGHDESCVCITESRTFLKKSNLHKNTCVRKLVCIVYERCLKRYRDLQIVVMLGEARGIVFDKHDHAA